MAGQQVHYTAKIEARKSDLERRQGSDTCCFDWQLKLHVQSSLLNEPEYCIFC